SQFFPIEYKKTHQPNFIPVQPKKYSEAVKSPAEQNRIPLKNKFETLNSLEKDNNHIETESTFSYQRPIRQANRRNKNQPIRPHLP
ncbi:hypothetical protein J6590_107787, partial [Homalodisca vitripennis]